MRKAKETETLVGVHILHIDNLKNNKKYNNKDKEISSCECFYTG